MPFRFFPFLIFRCFFFMFHCSIFEHFFIFSFSIVTFFFIFSCFFRFFFFSIVPLSPGALLKHRFFLQKIIILRHDSG